MLAAIEAALNKLADGPMHPREIERVARTFAALTRTLRELYELLSRHQPHAARDYVLPEDTDAAREELVRRIEALRASWADEDSAAQPAAASETK